MGKNQYLDQAAELFARRHPQVHFLTFDLPSEPGPKTWEEFNQALLKFMQNGSGPNEVKYNSQRIEPSDQADQTHQKALFSPPDSAMTRKWLATQPKISQLWTQVLADDRVDQELRKLNASADAEFRHVFLNSRQYLANFKQHRPAFFKRPIWVLQARGPGTDYFDASLDELRKQAEQVQVIEFSNHELLKAWSELKSRVGSQPISLALLSFRHEGLDSLRDDPVFISANKLILYGRRLAPFAPKSKAGEETHVHFWIPFLGQDRANAANDNCEFVRSYRDAFGRDPDFHAAYLYAGLQVLLKTRELQHDQSATSQKPVLESILGEAQFDSMGRIKGLIYPAFVNWGPQGISITLQHLGSGSKNSVARICEDLLPQRLQGQRIQLQSLSR
ncbi:MAG TPA: hypothetical protein PLZ57_13650 [Pseudobdellovibrionaceae bacterium]|nr:hypothetical protein [Pseudobdellovibrionaceae bacterium]